MTRIELTFWICFFSTLIFTYSCKPTTKHKTLNPSPNLELVKGVITENEKIASTENPAVLYKSYDLGKTWAPFAKGIPSDATLSGIQQNGIKIYLSTDYNGIFVSKNGEDNWKALSEEYLKALDINCIDAEGDKIVIGTLKNGILISKDDGLTWDPSREKINSAIRAFIRFRNKLYAGTDVGIFMSTDGGVSWSHTFGQMQILGFTKLNNKIYAATQNGVLMNDGNNSSWNSIYSGDALHDVGNDGRYIYAMTIGQELLKSQNDGVLWENAQNGIERPPNFYTNELVHLGNTVFSAQWDGIYQSINNGSKWQKLNGLPDSTAFSTLAKTDFGILAGISIR